MQTTQGITYSSEEMQGGLSGKIPKKCGSTASGSQVYIYFRNNSMQHVAPHQFQNSI